MSNRYINPSGFTENLPAEQLVEDDLKARIQQIAESYGYTHLETASVEYMETLASKGDVNKEIYTIGRAMAEGETKESDRGLHFDLTVPFARYVAQHQNDLQFPYRRYQIQKVWRGERPQKGRFREFYQADVDVVAQTNLPIEFDAEIAIVMARIIGSFAIGPVTMHINNRKFLNGLFASLGIKQTERAMQVIDKLDKIGEDEVKRLLREEVEMNQETIETLFKIISAKVSADEVGTFLQSVPGENEILEEGKRELEQVFNILTETKKDNRVEFVFNPSVARGLDYYTGTIYETTVDGLERYGSICSGGRYADLATRFTKQNLPGVGMSIGLTRLLAMLKAEALVSFDRGTKSHLSVCLMDESRLIDSLQMAETLREKGLCVEVNYKYKAPLGKQLSGAHEKGIPYALVLELDGQMTLYKLDDNEKQAFSSGEELTKYLLEQLSLD